MTANRADNGHPSQLPLREAGQEGQVQGAHHGQARSQHADIRRVQSHHRERGSCPSVILRIDHISFDLLSDHGPSRFSDSRFLRPPGRQVSQAL